MTWWVCTVIEFLVAFRLQASIRNIIGPNCTYTSFLALSIQEKIQQGFLLFFSTGTIAVGVSADKGWDLFDVTMTDIHY